MTTTYPPLPRVFDELIQALEKDNLNRLTVILQREGIIDTLEREAGNPKLSFDRSPLHLAARAEGQEDYVFMFVASGIPVNTVATTKEGDRLTALQTAVLHRRTGAVRTLLKMNADVSVVGTVGGYKATAEDWALGRRPLPPGFAQDPNLDPEISKMFRMAASARDFSPNLQKMMLVIFVLAPITSFLFFSALKYFKETS